MLNEMLPCNYNAITNRTDSPFAGCRSFTFQNVTRIEMPEICFKAYFMFAEKVSAWSIIITFIVTNRNRIDR